MYLNVYTVYVYIPIEGDSRIEATPAYNGWVEVIFLVQVVSVYLDAGEQPSSLPLSDITNNPDLIIMAVKCEIEWQRCDADLSHRSPLDS